MAAMLSSFSSIIRVRSSLAELGVTGGISLRSLATAAKFAFGSVASDAAVASQRITALKAQIATTGPMVGTLSSYTTNSGIIIPSGFSKGGKSVGAEAAKASGAVDKLNSSMLVTGTAGAKAAGGVVRRLVVLLSLLRQVLKALRAQHYLVVLLACWQVTGVGLLLVLSA